MRQESATSPFEAIPHTPADPYQSSGPRGAISDEARAYYDGERAVAENPRDPRHIWPELPQDASVLSVGCGGGWDGEALQCHRFVGLDINAEAIAYRLEHWPDSECYLGRGENLPFADEDFDFCMARVSVMYMDMSTFFAEASRVLVDGGQVWFTCHDFDHVLSHLYRSLRARRVKDVLFRTFVICNGALFHFTGRQVRSTRLRALNETFQTRVGLLRGLERAGFVDVQFPATARGHFLVTARKARRMSPRLVRSLTIDADRQIDVATR